jgi:hypothetical protein
MESPRNWRLTYEYWLQQSPQLLPKHIRSSNPEPQRALVEMGQVGGLLESCAEEERVLLPWADADRVDLINGRILSRCPSVC